MGSADLPNPDRFAKLLCDDDQNNSARIPPRVPINCLRPESKLLPPLPPPKYIAFPLGNGGDFKDFDYAIKSEYLVGPDEDTKDADTLSSAAPPTGSETLVSQSNTDEPSHVNPRETKTGDNFLHLNDGTSKRSREPSLITSIEHVATRHTREVPLSEQQAEHVTSEHQLKNVQDDTRNKQQSHGRVDAYDYSLHRNNRGLMEANNYNSAISQAMKREYVNRRQNNRINKRQLENIRGSFIRCNDGSLLEVRDPALLAPGSENEIGNTRRMKIRTERDTLNDELNLNIRERKPYVCQQLAPFDLSDYRNAYRLGRPSKHIHNEFLRWQGNTGGDSTFAISPQDMDLNQVPADLEDDPEYQKFIKFKDHIKAKLEDQHCNAQMNDDKPSSPGMFGENLAIGRQARVHVAFVTPASRGDAGEDPISFDNDNIELEPMEFLEGNNTGLGYVEGLMDMEFAYNDNANQIIRAEFHTPSGYKADVDKMNAALMANPIKYAGIFMGGDTDTSVDVSGKTYSALRDFVVENTDSNNLKRIFNPH